MRDILRNAPKRRMAEDETMLPGGSTVPIDDLEERGMMSDALMRKARPEVYAAAHGGYSPGQVDVMERARRPERDFLEAAPLGLREDEVELPGGGQASFDDLESVGGVTPELMAKARPEVQAFEASRSPEERARERMRGMMQATQPRVNERRREMGDAAMIRRIIGEERPGISPAQVSRHMAEYRRDPEGFGRTFYPMAAQERETMSIADRAAQRVAAERDARAREIMDTLERGRR